MAAMGCIIAAMGFMNPITRIYGKSAVTNGRNSNSTTGAAGQDRSVAKGLRGFGRGGSRIA